MDSEKPENKAQPMKKRSVRLVREHFEEVVTQLSGFVAFMFRFLFVGAVIDIRLGA